MSASGRFLPLCVLAIAGGSAIGWLLREPPAAKQPPAVEKPAPAQPAPAPGNVAAPAPAQQPPAPQAPKRPMARFPNGVEVELLNGVAIPVLMQWGAGQDWSPIKDKYRDERGLDWYRHEDKTWSTTVMRTDLASGKEVGLGLVFHDAGPGKPTVQAGISPPVK